MKKIFLALAAVAALAACSKVEAEYTSSDEIAFAPVASNRTKTMLSETTTFPDENFNLWAFYKQVDPGTNIAGWQASDAAQQTYVEEKTFVKKSNGLWHGETSYYWPKLGSLMFVGYYPTSIAGQVNYTFTKDVNKMTIVNYVPGFVTTNTTHEEDLMYFNMTPASYRNTDVPVTFRHALSWIQVVLAKDADTSGDATITVNSAEFVGVSPFGNAVVNNSPDTAADETNEIQWTAWGETKNVVVTEDAGHVLVPNNTTPLEKQPLFIPQGMTSLLVTYTIASEDGSKFTETKDIPLANIITDHNSWKPGRKYVYTVTIGTREIYIKPSVVDWATVEVPVNDFNQYDQYPQPDNNGGGENGENGENA